MAPTRTKTRKPSPQKAAEAESSWGAPSAATTEYAVGDGVTHPQFGDGTVTEIESDKLTIEFADGRMKQIVDYYVRRRRQVTSSRSPTSHQTPPTPPKEHPSTGTE